jgi:adenylate cyclase
LEEQAAKLVVTTLDQPENTFTLGDILTIGRAPNNQLVLEDKRASRNHAEIRRIAGRYRLSDLGSSNGTWIKGRRLTAPKDLEDGDEILIGAVQLRFVAPGGESSETVAAETGTVLSMRNESVVVLVADIRNFTTMSESLPGGEFSRLISAWFREASDIIEGSGGTVDKYIGDAVMAFWLIREKSAPHREVNASLEAARALLARAGGFAEQIAAQFPGKTFRIGIGLNMGSAMMGNVGTSKNQSFTILGDSVNVAFRLEALSKEKGLPVIMGRNMLEFASPSYRFRDLGQAEVKGRVEPIPVCGLEVESSPR